MSDETDRADELLRRARELEARTADRVAESRARAARSRTERMRDGLADVAWLTGGIRRLERFASEAAQVLDHALRWTGPLWWIVRKAWAGARFVAHRASHVRVDGDVFDFSPRKAARSLLVFLAMPVVVYALYNLTTRHSGVFLINDKHLVSGETDEYQIGGCWRHVAGQSVCERGEGEIVLIRPVWIPETGIFSITYDEDVGVVPLQGWCELTTYGIYLRPPWMPFLRGALKPVAIGIGQCQGLASEHGHKAEQTPE